MLRNSTKSGYKLVTRLYLASRKTGNCSLYLERLYAYLKIRDSITREGRMDMMKDSYFSAPYCPITSTSGQGD